MGSNPSKTELLNDLRKVADDLNESPTARQYQDKGDYSPSTIQRRFGGWNKAKEEANLKIYSNEGQKITQIKN